jgi:hypothetical protein
MLGDWHAGGRGDERRACRNIESARAIATGAGRVEHPAVIEIERPRTLAHRADAAGQLGRGFALQADRDQQAGDQRVGYDVVENLAEDALRFGGVERTPSEDLVEGLPQRDHPPSPLRKFCRIALPAGVPIDSG